VQTEAERSRRAPPPGATDSPAPRRNRAPADRLRTICFVARVVIVLIAALRAWDARHDVSPDGISYLDLSDAVVQGRWLGLVSTYWSPLYPALIGVARIALSWTSLGTPANEFALVHVVNLALFVLSFAAFEWLVSELTKSSGGWESHALASAWGRVGAYALFGALTLAMSPPSLTTPDLLVNTACFSAFASLLRVERRGSGADAALLGASLGAGVLAKSFMVPFSVLMLGLVAIRLGARGSRTLVIAAGAWLLLTAPWVAAMTHSAGHFTIGETGRLNYLWFVNGQQPPNGPDLPTAALVASDQVMSGMAVMPEPRGTNPLWLDPAPWYRGLQVHFDVSRQLAVLKHGLQYYLTLFAPLILAGAVLIAVSDFARLRLAWRRSWPILLPCVAGLVAYALVYTLARYLVPFVTAAALLVGVALEPAPSGRREGLRAALAVAFVLAIEWSLGATRHFLVLPLAMAATMPVYVALVSRRRATSIGASIAVGILIAGIADRCPTSWYPLFIVTIGAATWFAMRQTAAVAGPARASRALRSAAIAAALCVLCVRVGRDTRGAMAALSEDRSRGENPSWIIARELAALGVDPGSKVAVIASPYDAGWARLGRLQLAGAVPPSRANSYWQLDEAGRLTASKLFASAGAVAVVAVPAPDTLPRGWTRIRGGAVLLIR
ncbi:MAG TPA: hypothetical protein VJW73_20165, partial [Gemmatimonadaceae bacterium]|nr:hypothetical protein [Gemmatimonadaceae bacterium]